MRFHNAFLFTIKSVSRFNGLLPKSFFSGSETFFDKSKARSRRFQNSPFGLKQLESLFFYFAKIYGQKTFQRALKEIFVLGNSPLRNNYCKRQEIKRVSRKN
jgi:hypothetical protein